MWKKIMKTINSLIWIALITLVFFIAADRITALFLSDPNVIDNYTLNKLVVPKPILYYSGKPNINLGKESLNALGYRGELPSHEKPSDEYRIFILGGSTVFSGDPPIPDLVEKCLHYELPTSIHVSVYNFGVLSQNSSMELARIVFEISDMKPDMIIMYSGANDVHSPVFADPRPGYPGNFMIMENNPLQMPAESYPTLMMLFWKSNLFRYLITKSPIILDYYKEKLCSFSRLRMENNYMSEQWIGAIARAYCGNIEKAAIVSGSYNAHFIGFFQPMVFYKDYPDSQEQVCVEQYTNKEIDYHFKVRNIIRAEFKRMAQDNIHVKDISDLYDSTPETVFTDFCHTLQNQKTKVAAEIAREIIPVISKRFELN